MLKLKSAVRLMRVISNDPLMSQVFTVPGSASFSVRSVEYGSMMLFQSTAARELPAARSGERMTVKLPPTAIRLSAVGAIGTVGPSLSSTDGPVGGVTPFSSGSAGAAGSSAASGSSAGSSSPGAACSGAAPRSKVAASSVMSVR